MITGGNRGPKKELIEQARTRINERVGRVVQASSPMESEAWGFQAEAPFLNQVLVVESSLEPLELLAVTQQIEQELGRDRTLEATEKRLTGEPYASRSMDIDILYYGDRVIDHARLQIPHPRLEERAFVLRPLVEILPKWRDPRSGRRVEELWAALNEKNEAKR